MLLSRCTAWLAIVAVPVCGLPLEAHNTTMSSSLTTPAAVPPSTYHAMEKDYFAKDPFQEPSEPEVREPGEKAKKPPGAKNPIVKAPSDSGMRVIHVADYDEVTSRHKKILNNKSQKNVVFHLADSNTYLMRQTDSSPESNPGSSLPVDTPVENIDHVGAMENTNKNIEMQAGPDEDNEDTWVEIDHGETTPGEYPGYVPISSCLSQKYGDQGEISFGWSYGTSIEAKSSLGVSVSVYLFTLSVNLDITLTTSLSVSGTATCTVNKGTVGQILLKPNFLCSYPKTRRARFSRKLQRFMMDKDFKQHGRMLALLKDNMGQIDCATSDIVPLFCEGTKLGEVNWDNPLGADYNSMSLRLPVSFASHPN